MPFHDRGYNNHRNSYHGRSGPRDRIDEKQVPESKHTVFIRGLSGDITTDEVKTYIEERIGKISFDFVKVSQDRSKLFVAARFATRDDAKTFMNKYDREFMGSHCHLSWFRDIRRYCAYQQNKQQARRDESPRRRRIRSESDENSQRSSPPSRSLSRSKSRSPVRSYNDDSDDGSRNRRRSRRNKTPSRTPSRSPRRGDREAARRSATPSDTESDHGYKRGRNSDRRDRKRRHEYDSEEDDKADKTDVSIVSPISTSSRSVSRESQERKKGKKSNKLSGIPLPPAQPAPVKKSPIRESPVKKSPIRESPIKESPVKESPVKQLTIKQSPVHDTSADKSASDSPGFIAPPIHVKEEPLEVKKPIIPVREIKINLRKEEYLPVAPQPPPPIVEHIRNTRFSVGMNEESIPKTIQSNDYMHNTMSDYYHGNIAPSAPVPPYQAPQNPYQHKIEIKPITSSLLPSLVPQQVYKPKPPATFTPSDSTNIVPQPPVTPVTGNQNMAAATSIDENIYPTTMKMFGHLKEVQNNILATIKYVPKEEPSDNYSTLRLSSFGTEDDTEEVKCLERELKLSKLTDEQLIRFTIKKKQFEAAYRGDCETYATVTRALLSKDESLAVGLKVALLENMEDLYKKMMERVDDHLKTIC